MLTPKIGHDKSCLYNCYLISHKCHYLCPFHYYYHKITILYMCNYLPCLCYDTTPTTSSPSLSRPPPTPKSNITNPGSIHMQLSQPPTTQHHHPCITHAPTHARPSLLVNQNPSLTRTQTGVSGLHDTAASF